MPLPIIKEEVGGSISHDLLAQPGNKYVVDILRKLQKTDPYLANVISYYSEKSPDSMHVATGMILVYRLLESQTEANELLEAIGPKCFTQNRTHIQQKEQRMRGKLKFLIFETFVLPGYLLVKLLSKIKRMGDGTDNESVMIDEMMWATFLSVVFYVSIMIGIFWIWKLFPFSVHFVWK